MRTFLLLSAAALLAVGCAPDSMTDPFGAQASRSAAAPSLPSADTTVAQLDPRALLGKDVRASDGTKVGVVQDVLLDAGDRPSRLVVGTGGYLTGGLLGLGEHRVTLDAGDLRYMAGRGAVVAPSLSRAQFAALPEYRGDGSAVSLNRSRRGS